jgi:hypothetical protein
MVIKNALVDWLFVWEPGNKGKYSCCIILDKTDPQWKTLEAEYDKAIAKGIAGNKFTKQQTQSSAFKKLFRDGDVEIETEGRPKHYAGKRFFNANNKSQPGIVDQKGQPLLDRNRLYSGCVCHVDVGVYPYNNESKGVGAGFNHIMLVKEGERLDGRTTAEDAFKGLTVEDEDAGANNGLQ